MARTLTDLQTNIRAHARDNQADFITNTANLNLVNKEYRKLAIAVPWSEFYSVDETLQTVVDQEAYTWPSGAPEAITTVEVEADISGGAEFGEFIFGVDLFGPANVKYRLLTRPPSELDWVLAGQRESTDWPLYYRRQTTSGVHQIAIRPAPNTINRTVRLAGQVEPTELTVGGSTTLFDDDIGDDVLELVVAAAYVSREGKTDDRVESLTQEALTLISSYFGK